jgi:hypothetical protein
MPSLEHQTLDTHRVTLPADNKTYAAIPERRIDDSAVNKGQAKTYSSHKEDKSKPSISENNDSCMKKLNLSTRQARTRIKSRNGTEDALAKRVRHCDSPAQINSDYFILEIRRDHITF